MNWIKYIFIFFISFNIFALSLDDEKKYDELEGFSFVKALYLDKKYKEVIKYADNLKINSNDLGDYFYYIADAYLNMQQYSLSQNYMEKAANLNKSNSNDYYLSYAKLNFELKNYKGCTDKIEKVNKWVLKLSDWKLYTKCLESDNRIDDLLSLYLNTSIDDFDYILESQRVLIKYKLIETARLNRLKLMSRCYFVNDYINLISILDDNNIKDNEIVELAHRCHPKSIDVSGHLIKRLFTNNLNNSIAYLFYDLSLDDVKFRKHAAEFFKVASRFIESYYFSSIADSETYVMSRAENYLNSESIAKLYSMPIESSLLKKNRDLSYAKSFAALKYSRNNEAYDFLIKYIDKRSTKEDLLLTMIKKCQEMDYKCRP